MKAPYEAPRITILVTNDIRAVEDPETRAAIRAIEKVNCRRTLQLNADRVAHFKGRIAALNLSWDDVVIVLLNLDDMHGGEIAAILMPDADWQQYRDRGEVPFARGLATRGGIARALDLFDSEAAAKLRSIRDVAVVVVDHGVAETFAAGDL